MMSSGGSPVRTPRKKICSALNSSVNRATSAHLLEQARQLGVLREPHTQALEVVSQQVPDPEGHELPGAVEPAFEDEQHRFVHTESKGLQRNLMQHSVETSSAFVIPRELLQRFYFQRKRCLCSTVRRHVEFNSEERVDNFARHLFSRDHGRRNVSFSTVSKLVFDKLAEHSRVMFVKDVLDMKGWGFKTRSHARRSAGVFEIGRCEAGTTGEVPFVTVDGAEIAARYKTRRERLTQRRC